MTPMLLSGDPARTRTWRATTAIRTFALALGIGRLMSAGSLSDVAVPVGVITVIVAVACAVERDAAERQLRWVPVVESVVVASLLVTSGAEAVESLFLYLAVPPVVGGVRHGWVTATNTCLASATAFIAVGSAYDRVDYYANLDVGVFWLTIGFGIALLAAWQTRAVRELEDARAPVAEAHRLLVQLQSLAQDGGIGLDSSGAGELLVTSIQKRVNSNRAAVFTQNRDGSLALLWSHGPIDGLAEAAAKVGRDVIASPETLALPVVSAEERVVAVVVMGDLTAWHGDTVEVARRVVSRHALRLDTALIFDDVRGLATSEERNRIAREMHDGVAQELVALGYAVDEIGAVTSEPQTRDLSASLRGEISRIVSDLRFSIFDLRHEVSNRSLATAISDYANAVAAQSELRVHLTLDEAGTHLSSRTRTEVLRVAQEAIGNVRRHAKAASLWVTWTTDAQSLCLRVEDDGIGNAAPREQHYGLHTMRERAELLGASLTVQERPGGGTILELRSGSHVQPPQEAAGVHHRAAGR